MTINFAKHSLAALSSFKTYLEHLSDAELAERLAKTAISGKATKARMDAGERGEACGQHMERGRWMTSYSLETNLNLLRHSWSMTRLEQRRREAKVAA